MIAIAKPEPTPIVVVFHFEDDGWHFGNIDRTELTVRFFKPMSLSCWWKYSSWKPRFWRRWHRHASHRCYCGDGCMFDGSVSVFGFTVVWFFSRYWGEIPCHCDRVIAELDQEPSHE